MNNLQIEQLLRRAPTPPPPAGLKEQLKTGIRLAAPPPERIVAGASAPLWRRWFPALSFGLLFLGCMLALAVQTTQIRELRRENASLRSAAADLDPLRRNRAELETLRAAAVQDQERAKNEHGELLKLRGEIRQLRTAAQELSGLRAENQRLQALAAAAAAVPALAPGARSGGPSIRFSETNWDFGQVISSEPQSHVFVFANVGNAPLEILDVKPSCGCTTAGEWDRRVAPGKTGEIPIVFNPSKFAGPVVKLITVTCNDPETPVLKLIIRGEITRSNDAQP